jgi:hypothetical protein
MPTLTISIDYDTEAQRLALEQTLAYLQHLHHTATTAPHGTVLQTCEQVVLTQGRDALRTTLQAALDARIQAVDHAQKKSPSPGPKDPAPVGF